MIDILLCMVFLLIISSRFFIYPTHRLKREIFYFLLFLYLNCLFFLSHSSFIFFRSNIVQLFYILAPMLVVLHTIIFQKGLMANETLYLYLIIFVYIAFIITILFVFELLFTEVLKKIKYIHHGLGSE